MSSNADGTEAETHASADLLATAAAKPAALIVDGPAGIGKTTLWLGTVERARAQGFRVLSARPSQVESVLAYGVLADLLSDVDNDVYAHLPEPQRHAIDQVLLRGLANGHAEGGTDARTVAAAFLSTLEALARESPVLVAIDDMQWLDASSAHAVGFAARRFTGRTAMLATVRADPGSVDPAAWLQLPRPEDIRRITLTALSIGRLHALVVERLGRSLARPTIVRIHDVSGGNPFYALELARTLDEDAANADTELPGTLAQLVRQRIERLDADVVEALLAAACLASPTVELVAGAVVSDAAHLVGLLGAAETAGIIAIDGDTLRFTHPLLARGVYTGSTRARRREMHRRLAELVTEPELQARHRALSATRADPDTLQALDAGAQMARLRGAPATAAELLDLAVGLGGDAPERRIRSAVLHFESGDPARARTALSDVISALPPGILRAEAVCHLAVVQIADDFADADESLSGPAIDEAGENLALRARMLVTRSFALVNSGRLEEALNAAEDAIAVAERLDQTDLLSQALGVRIVLRFMAGDGVDELDLKSALANADDRSGIPPFFRPRVLAALLRGWTGQLDEASVELQSIWQGCIEHGQESDLMFLAFHRSLIEVWLGNVDQAARISEDTLERAQQLGGDLALSVAMMARSAVAVYAGHVDDARHAIDQALAASARCSSHRLSEWPRTHLGFLEVSLRNYSAALATLQPLLTMIESAQEATEIISSSFVPDAVEALIGLGRLHEALPLIERLETNGRRLDRAWMLAVGARGRALLHATNGDLDAALLSAQRAMSEHDRLPMPFERARTQLLLGQILRRRRQKEASATVLQEALVTFTGLGTDLWAERTRTELARSNTGPRTSSMLTPSEQRVAECVATGMTTRDVAAALFISPKTVEANISRIYRKLDISSRAELGRHMSAAIPSRGLGG